MPLDKTAARQRIQKFDFPGLFTQELGWDWHKPTQTVTLAGRSFTLQAVAEKRGFVAWHCPTPAGEKLPDSAFRRRIEREVTKAAHEHLVIYTDAAQSLQVWQWVRREPGKPLRVRETLWSKGQSGELLIQKLDPLFVSFDDEETISLPIIAGRAAANVDERVTKRFYEEFRKQHAAFLKFITGIPNQSDHEWYASVMLNRLMFLYFVQRKGFLDGDTDYLRNRLQKLKAEHGKDKFYNFYRYFLLKLFHGGLNARLKDRQPELEKLLGRVPYLNGGIFDVHSLERTYGDAIQIPDTAFEAIFKYFDEWQWHLDERPLRADKEINPDVLGYIFEKYINQKQMGAYYTKEDITEYIGKNTILPFLFDAVRGKVKAAFEGDASVWSHLQSDPDRYLYPAVRHGLSWDYQPGHPEQGEPLAKERPLPADIAAGLDPTKPNLLERRKPWNKPAPAEFGLPTEIWRETVARRQRCAEVRKKLAAGEVREIADFITLNLDLRRFAQDVIARCDSAELLAAFWHTLAGRPARNSREKPQPALTILDITCGSGAFLFAALNILEPLYEACLDRMEGLLADARASGAKIHPDSHLAEFESILQQVAKHPNERYFIFKTIILHNLYGVDLMEEAVEICKLRLFLKLAAQVEPDADDANLGIEPLPDIDFNIRAGNALVGYATRAELEGVAERDLLLKEEVKEVLEAAEDAAAAYEVFVRSQLEGENPGEFKRRLLEKFGHAREQCDRFLAESYRMGITKKPKEFAEWKRSHQPFHWFVEFFGILNAGGFDVMIGNPPYLEYSKVTTYAVRNYRTARCGNLYAFTMERAVQLCDSLGRSGMIVPISLACSGALEPLRLEFSRQQRTTWFSHFSNRPGQLFTGAQNRLTIFLTSGEQREQEYFTTRYHRWNARDGEREHLFSTLSYQPFSTSDSLFHGLFAKIGSAHGTSVHTKLRSSKSVELFTSKLAKHRVFWVRVPGYFCQFLLEPPMARSEKGGASRVRGEVNSIGFSRVDLCRIAHAWLNSSTYYLFFCAYTDTRHINPSDVAEFPADLGGLSPEIAGQLEALSIKLGKCSRANTSQWRKSGLLIDSVDSKPCKPILDEIDTVLAAHYGFTNEELDFIVNYDIKYRLGRGGEEEEA